MTKLMEKVDTLTPMELYTTVIGFMISKKEKELSTGLMELDMKVNLRME